MRRLMAAVAATALMAATDAAADDWRLAGANNDIMAGVEVSTIRRDGDLSAAMVLLSFARTQSDGGDYYILLVGFDCAARVTTTLITDAFRADGTLLARDDEDIEQRVERGTLMHAAEEVVCRGRRSDTSTPDAVQFARVARRTLLSAAAER